MGTAKRFHAKNGVDNNSQTIINVATPVNNTDAANKSYADTKLALTGGTLTGSSSGNTLELLALSNTGSGANTKARLNFYSTSTSYGSIAGGYGASAPEMVFDLPSGTPGNYIWQITGAEKMRLDSSGNLGVGTTSPTNYGAGYKTLAVNGTSSGVIELQANGTVRGYLAADANDLQIVANSTNPIRLFTNGAERMRITSAGRVGIGTTTPSYDLDVSRTGVVAVVAATSNTQSVLRAEITGNVALDLNAVSGYGELRTANNYPLLISTNGNERMRITAAGDVGIGTSSPASLTKLTVYQDSTFAVQLMNASQNYTLRIDSGFSNALVLGNRTSFVDLITVSTSGNLGIGTTSPDRALVVARGAATDALVSMRGNGNGAAAEFFTGQDTNSWGYLWNRSSSPVVFGTNNAERVRIGANGNVAIGSTDTSIGRLNVVGSAASSIPLVFDSNASYGEIQTYSSSPLYLNRQGNNVIMNLGGGNVGVGTSSPSFPLDVNGFMGVGAKTALPGVGGNVRYRDDTGTQRYVAGILGSAGETSYSIYDAIAGDWRVQITSAGNVGIGTSSPGAKLHVYGAGATQAYFTSSDQTTSYIRFINTANNGGYVGYTNDNLVFLTGSSEKMRLDTSGNLGVGGTLAAWGSTSRAIGVAASTAAFVSGRTDAYRLHIGLNAYESASDVWRYTVGLAASRYTQIDGQHQWFTAPSGTAGAAITFAQSMTLDASGNLSLVAGTTSMTNGFIYIPAAAGNPTGAATAITGTVPLYYNSSANTLHAYNSTWQTISGGLSLVSSSPNSIVYLNSSSQATTSASLQYDGSELTVYNGVNSYVSSTAGSAVVRIGNSATLELSTFRQYGDTATGTTDGLNNAGLGVISFGGSNGALIRTTQPDPIVFSTNSTEKMRLTSSGLLGIGTNSPGGSGVHVVNNAGGALFYASGAVSGGNVAYLTYNSSNTANATASYAFWNDNGFSANSANIAFYSSTSGNELRITNGANAPITLYTNGTERARVTNGGALCIGATSTVGSSPLYIKSTGSTSATNAIYINNSASTGLFTIWDNGTFITGVAAASPYNNTTASAANVVVTSLGTLQRSTSSLRYKKNVQGAVHGLEEVLSLRPVTFQTKNGDEKTYSGFIAEEVHEAGLEEFVEYNKEGQPDAVHYSNMVALCVKAIQEQQEIISQLKDRISTLESKQ